jgi:anti-sigma B factor antagonist
MVRPSGIGGPNFDRDGGLSPAVEQLVHIETSRVAHATGTALVVRVAGEIDLFTVDRFRTATVAGFDDLHDGEILVLDLTEVTFLASHGLQALVQATEAARQRREPLRIVVDHNRLVIRPLQLTGLAQVLALFDTIEDALYAPS